MNPLWQAALAVVAAPFLGIAPVLADEPPAFVGGAVCSGCHALEFEAWKGSHHALAMQPAGAATVLGDFGGAQFEHFGVTTTFFRDGEKFMVRTDGPDAALHEYSVASTFGVYPLQQYLIAMPGGRLQALAIAWDVGRKIKADSAGSTSIPTSGSSWRSAALDRAGSNLELSMRRPLDQSKEELRPRFR